MNIIAKIETGAVAVWNDIVNDIDADYSKVKAVLPASAAAGLANVVSDIKQGASDALGALADGAPTAGAELTTGLENLADSALATASNGVALPLVPMVNKGIDDIVSKGTAALQAWALKVKAGLAPATAAAAAVTE